MCDTIEVPDRVEAVVWWDSQNGVYKMTFGVYARGAEMGVIATTIKQRNGQTFASEHLVIPNINIICVIPMSVTGECLS